MGYRRDDRIATGRAAADELDEEIRAHIEMRVDDLVARGMSPEAAREEALGRFGDLEGSRRALLREIARRDRRRRWVARVGGLRDDLVRAVRNLRRAGGYTTLSLLILAAATGLATATFTVTDHALLRPLPYPEPSDLVALQSVGETGPFYQVSMANWVDWKERSHALASTALWRMWRMTIGGIGAEPFRVDGVVAHGDLWGTLGARFLMGRPFTEDEAQARERLAVLSEELWISAFGERSSLDGVSLEVDGVRYDVVGVVARGQGFPEDARVWIPAFYRAGSGAMRNNINYEALGRLAPGVGLERAREDLGSVARGIRESDPEGLYSYGVGVVPLLDRVAGGARRSLVVLMAAVLLVLVVACANLAGLALARARRREPDLVLRLVLGAGRARLARLVLVEHAVLAVLGTAVGVGLARSGVGPLLAALGGRIPRAGAAAVDGRVLLFALAIAAVAALATAAGPVAAVLRGRIGPGLQTARGGIRGGRRLPGAAVVATEMALATALLIGGGLLVRSFLAVASRPLGFDPSDVATLEVTLTGDAYDDPAAGVAYWNETLERIRRTPGVLSAGVGNWIPTGEAGTSFIDLEEGGDAELGAGYRVVSEGYLDALAVPLLAGRDFDDSDALGTERVGLVNQAAAARFWPGESPLGKRIKATSMEAYYHGGEAPWITVVGVVGDVRHHGFESDPRPELFVLYRQVPDWTRGMTLVVRARPGVLDEALPDLRSTLLELDPSLAVETATLASRVRALLAERRLVLAVIWTFAALALLLACLGVYALVSFAVEERTREMAIRSALGASRRGILLMMLGDAGRVLLAGVGGGVLVGLALGRVLRSLLVGVTATDPSTYVAAAVLLAAVGLGAALVPSWRAARTDPLRALGG